MENNKVQNSEDNDIYLNEIFSTVWKSKTSIFIITFVLSISSFLYSLLLPNIYTSQTLLAPASSESSFQNSLSGLSSLAGIAGISMPSESGNKTTEAIERLKSYNFFVNNFLPYINFNDLVAVKKWDKLSNTIIYDEEILLLKPSDQEAYAIYQQILGISENKKTSFVSLTLEHKSPYIARDWLNIIIKNVNNNMRELDKSLANDSIIFLNEKISKTNIAEMKVAISQIIEGQMQALMLAEVTQDYVFKPIDPPIAPEYKSKPSRSLIVVLGAIFGIIFGILMSLFRHYFKK
jgi:LPS O-antigen subunit length determinant protein (WzzB/FepE family)